VSDAKTVPDLLQEALDTFKDRNTTYGSTYKNHGIIMRGLFPNGIELKSVEDHNRFALLVMIVSKLYRYSHNFSTGGHNDSIHDLGVYAFMMEQLDLELK
jgi:hypothetical protein